MIMATRLGVTRTLAFLALLLFFGASTSLAGPVVVLGPGGFHTIVNPGNYRVVGTVRGIDVQASKVHVNLSEGVVNCQGVNGSRGINISSQTRVHVNASFTGKVQNCQHGILISGGGRHSINGVIIISMKQNGILISNGSSNNHIIGNETSSNSQNGIAVAGASPGNHINGNISFSNTRHGIRVNTLNNHINGNTALGNGDGTTFFDLTDDNADCDNNKWNSNVFDTSNQACIQ